MKNNEYQRLLDLKDVINSGSANSEQKNEYMKLMYENGHITKQQYNNYLSDPNADYIIKGALTIGAVLVAGWLVTKLFD